MGIESSRAPGGSAEKPLRPHWRDRPRFDITGKPPDLLHIDCNLYAGQANRPAPRGGPSVQAAIAVTSFSIGAPIKLPHSVQEPS